VAVAKRIFQLAKEFECDEKEIMTFLAKQGIKVSNRLSAVNEETYNLLKAKFAAPPPEPEPTPAPEVKSPPEVKEVKLEEAPTAQSGQPQPQPSGKKKKNKNKQPQPVEQNSEQVATPDDNPDKLVSDAKVARMGKQTQHALYEGIMAGNEFIRKYMPTFEQTIESNGQKKRKPMPSWNMDTWAILYNMKFEYPDSSPVRYWQAVAKLMTRAFKLLNAYGIKNREEFAKMRESTARIGKEYQPREIFTDEENQKFADQQKLLFETFGHGMGLINDNLYDLKLKAERMKVSYERMNYLEYVTNPQADLRSNDRVPFDELLEAVVYGVRGVARRFDFYYANKERIDKTLNDFFEWLDGYAKLKEQGALTAKLEKYLELEQKFVDIAEFMSFDNLLNYKKVRQGKATEFDTAVELLTAYRDDLDNPDAERNFKYKIRGLTNIIYKPKEFVFLYRFAGLEPHVDYRPPEEIAAAEAAKVAEQKENPAAVDEA